MAHHFWTPGSMNMCVELTKRLPHQCLNGPMHKKGFGVLGASFMHKQDHNNWKCEWKGKNWDKSPHNDYFWAIGVAIWRRDTKNMNTSWHPRFGLILNNFGCLVGSFAESSLLSLTTCFRGTSSFNRWPNPTMLLHSKCRNDTGRFQLQPHKKLLLPVHY